MRQKRGSRTGADGTRQWAPCDLRPWDLITSYPNQLEGLVTPYQEVVRSKTRLGAAAATPKHLRFVSIPMYRCLGR